MSTFKSFTDLEQSKKLSEILPIEAANMFWRYNHNIHTYDNIPKILETNNWDDADNKNIPCWSLAALLEYLRNINSTVYIPMLYVHDNKWMLQFVERGHGNVAEMECDNPVDVCYEMILKLHEQKLL